MPKTLKILFLEDTAEDAELAIAVLEDAGYTCVWDLVDTKEAFLASLKDNKYGLILSDYSLPSFDGLTAARLFDELDLGIPFILVSGTLGEEAAIEGLKAGASDFVLKNKMFRLPMVIERALSEMEEHRRVKEAEKENVRLAAQVEAERSRLNNIVASVPGVVWEAWGQPDVATQKIDFVSDYVETMLGYTVDEWLSTPNFWLTIVHPDDREAAAHTAAESFAAGSEMSSQQFRWMTKDGRIIWVETHSVTVFDDSGVPVGLRGVTIDITSRKQAEIERKVISQVIQGAISTPDLNEFLKLVHEAIGTIVYAENCFVMFVDEATGIISFEFWKDEREPRPEPKPLGKGFASHVLRTGQPLRLTPEIKEDLRNRGVTQQIGSVSASWIGVPLRTEERTIGVLVLRHYGNENAFTERDLEFLTAVGDQVALAIERKRASERIGQRESQLAEAQRLTHIGSWNWDFRTRRLEWSDEHYRIFGLEPGEIHPGYFSTVDEYVHPEDRGLVKDAVENTLTSLEPFDLHYRVVQRDGVVRMIHSRGKVDVDDSGAPVRLYGTAQDVTEKHLAQQALKESEERYRDLVENAIDIIYTHDLEGNYRSVNKAVEAITGYTAEESLTMNMMDCIAPEFLDKAREMMAAKLAGKDVTAYELDVIAKEGSRVTLEVNTRLIKDDDGNPVGVQGVARDITERNHLEEQFRQAQKMEAVGILAGGVAHDFNNLLTAISGYSDLTLRKMAPDDPLRRNIEGVKSAGDRAAGLTSQLLAFSRKQVLKPRVHNVNAVITEIEKMLRRIIRENIELRTMLDPELGNIKADPGQVEQVIMNLAVNARDAMPDGGRLAVETKNVYLTEDYVSHHLDVSPGPFIKISVSDTGSGMPRDVQQHIFEPFFTTKALGKGTGLGLSTVYGIVKQSGGDIVVYSELGHGTTFKIFLPCVDENVQAEKWIDVNQELLTGNETILLVEDEETVRDLVREILTGSGYNVLEADSGDAALEMCAAYSEPVHLLLTDVIMPRMGGVELSDRLRALVPDIKMLFMSGYTDDSIMDRGLLESKEAFIEKPFSPDELARKVRETLDA